MEINYMAHLKGFRIMRAINPIGANEICLYYILCEYNNELRFPEWFTAANSTIQGLTGLSIRALKEARNALIQKKYIKYKKGNGNQSGSYHILDFSYLVTNYVPQTVPQCIPQTVPQDVPQTSSNPDTLNKLNKTKRNETRDISAREEEHPPKPKPKKPKPDKKRYGEFNNVLLTDDEYNKLSERFGTAKAEAYIERLSGYIESKGAKYQSHYATMLNWSRKDGESENGKPTPASKFNNFSEQEEYDFDRLEKAAMAKLLEEAGT